MQWLEPVERYLEATVVIWLLDTVFKVKWFRSKTPSESMNLGADAH